MPKLMLSFSRDEISSTGFPVIVEGWDRAKDGSRKRRYNQEFSESERRYLADLYPHLYRWYLVTGTPKERVFSPGDFQLLQRACNFFATV